MCMIYGILVLYKPNNEYKNGYNRTMECILLIVFQFSNYVAFALYSIGIQIKRKRVKLLKRVFCQKECHAYNKFIRINNAHYVSVYKIFN